jgi:hypothetical protein
MSGRHIVGVPLTVAQSAVGDGVGMASRSGHSAGQGVPSEAGPAVAVGHARRRYHRSVISPALPGADVIAQGLDDLANRRESAAALLVSIGAPRLACLGISVPRPFETPEHRLYAVLVREHHDAAHGRYNSLLRRLVSFERAAACAR